MAYANYATPRMTVSSIFAVYMNGLSGPPPKAAPRNTRDVCDRPPMSLGPRAHGETAFDEHVSQRSAVDVHVNDPPRKRLLIFVGLHRELSHSGQ